MNTVVETERPLGLADDSNMVIISKEGVITIPFSSL